MHGLITTEPAPEGAAVECSEEGGEDEDAGWDVGPGGDGAPGPGGARRVCVPCASHVVCALYARACRAGRGATAAWVVMGWAGGGGSLC